MRQPPCDRCGNCCKTYPCSLWFYREGLLGRLSRGPYRAPYRCPSLVDHGTFTSCSLVTEAQEEDGSSKPLGWTGIVTRVLLVGLGCTASSQIRRGDRLPG